MVLLGLSVQDTGDDDNYRLEKMFLACLIWVIWIQIYIWLMNRRISQIPLSYQELMRILKADCEEMTLNTPNGSFRVVLANIGAKTVDHIAVALALTAAADGRASLGNRSVGVASCQVITSSETDTTETAHPIVYTEAVATNGYLKVSADEGDESELV